ncbi:hypothetical protein LSAT2_031338, partial [Lamellibrachia satsuma]
MLDGKDILAFDSHRIIGFATEDNLRQLCESIDMHGDGTFKTAPKLFHQLYTLLCSILATMQAWTQTIVLSSYALEHNAGLDTDHRPVILCAQTQRKPGHRPSSSH